jgi:sulfur carrier protein ThiS
MGQQKGNPTPSYQNQAYEALRPNTNARENRNYGTKPVMIDDNTTINDYIDLTFDTDAVAAMVSGSINTTIGAVSSSINTTIVSVISTGTQLASIMAYTASLLSVKLHSGSLINFANDAAAETGGVPVGNLYHTAGAVKVRLT